MVNESDNFTNNKNKPLANMKKLLILLTLLCSFTISHAQESINIDGVDCDIHVDIPRKVTPLFLAKLTHHS